MQLMLATRELDDPLNLSVMWMLADARAGKNGQHPLVGMLRPILIRSAWFFMMWVVVGKTAHGCAASPSQMRRFDGCRAGKNLVAL
jgi:hypothetical protein